MVPWLLAHWEEYHSGIMLYGNGYWGVTEANYVMVALHLLTAFAGPGAHAAHPRCSAHRPLSLIDGWGMVLSLEHGR